LAEGRRRVVGSLAGLIGLDQGLGRGDQDRGSVDASRHVRQGLRRMLAADPPQMRPRRLAKAAGPAAKGHWEQVVKKRAESKAKDKLGKTPVSATPAAATTGPIWTAKFRARRATLSLDGFWPVFGRARQA
jgi:hypothetical protein